MALQNQSLQNIKNALELSSSVISPETPSKESNSNDTAVKPTSSTQPSNTNANAEFVPHLFYSLHQIRKEPNNSSNQLETAVGFIKHRLKSCKACIETDEECQKLLSKSLEEWHEHNKQQQLELEAKKKVLRNLHDKIDDMLAT